MSILTNSAKRLCRISTLVLLLALTPALHAADKIKALIVDGWNAFHPVWPKSMVMKRQHLEVRGPFEAAAVAAHTEIETQRR